MANNSRFHWSSLSSRLLTATYLLVVWSAAFSSSLSVSTAENNSSNSSQIAIKFPTTQSPTNLTSSPTHFPESPAHLPDNHTPFPESPTDVPKSPTDAPENPTEGSNNTSVEDLPQFLQDIINNISEEKHVNFSRISDRERRQLFIDLPGSNGIGQQRRQDEPRVCTTPSKEQGYCKDLGDCPDLILDLSNLRRSVCFKGIFVPGVCCPKSAMRSDEEPTTRRPPTSPSRFVTPRPRPGDNDDRTSVTRRPVSQHPNAAYRCGVPRVPEQRIVGGKESPKGKWPWMAAIFLHGPKKTEFWCGGSLISARFILTAAHCTKDPNGKTFNPRQFTVRLGDYNIFSKSDDHLVDPETYRVEKITPHPDFKARGFYNDVALIKVNREVRFSDFIAPICLPPPAMAAEPLDALVNQRPTVIGYGSTHYDGEESPFLREAKLPIWTNLECDDAYLQPITDIFLCAGYKKGGTDACQGDSGGPLLLYVSSRQWVQIGIVSFGNRCAEPGYPGVYTRLTKFMPWIHENMIQQ